MKNAKSYRSRYILGGDTEFSPGFLAWWDKRQFPADPSDVIYKMEKIYENNPPALGYVFYKDPALWWLICQYNDILDPIEELKEGKLLYIPSITRIRAFERSLSTYNYVKK